MSARGNPGDEAWSLYVAASISYFLAVVGVCLRTYVRRCIVRNMSFDDWLMILSLAVYTMYLAFVLVGLHYGTGRHHVDLPAGDVVMAVKYWFFCEWAYVITMTVIKVAIAIFYLRLTISRWQRLLVNVIMYAVIVFGVVYFGCVVVQCYPVPFIWQRFSERSPTSLIYNPMSGPAPQGNCLPDAVVVWGTYLHSILSAAADWSLGLLPIAMLWRVRLGFGTKLMVAGLLGCGAVASTATLVRIGYIHNINDIGDFLWNTIGIAIWSTIEPGFALFAAGLATLRPLLRSIFPNRFRNLRISSHLTASFGDGGNDDRHGGGYEDQSSEHKPSVALQAPESLQQPDVYSRPSLSTHIKHEEPRVADNYVSDQASVMSGKSREVVIRLDAPTLFNPNARIEPSLPSPSSVRTYPASFMTGRSRDVPFGITNSQLPTGLQSLSVSRSNSRSRSLERTTSAAPTVPPCAPLPLPPLAVLTSRRFEALAKHRLEKKEKARASEVRKSWKRIAGVLDEGRITEENNSNEQDDRNGCKTRQSVLLIGVERPAPWSDVIPPSPAPLSTFDSATSARAFAVRVGDAFTNDGPRASGALCRGTLLRGDGHGQWHE